MTDEDISDEGSRPPAGGPRHAAPRGQLRRRLHLPAGRVLAIAAVPTALLMGAGYTPTLALADESSAKAGARTCATATDTPVPDATPSATGNGSSEPAPGGGSPTVEPSAPESSAPAPQQTEPAEPTEPADTTAPDPTEAASGPASGPTSVSRGTLDASAARRLTRAVRVPASLAVPAASATRGTAAAHAQSQGLIGDLLGGVGDLLTGGSASSSPSPSASSTSISPPPADPSPENTTPEPSTPQPSTPQPSTPEPSPPAGKGGTAPKPKTAKDTAAKAAAAETTASPSVTATPASTPMPSESADVDPLCATDASGLKARTEPGGGVVPDQPWTLKSSRLALHGAVFGGVVEVTTSSGTAKRVLKFTVDSIDIGDLDMSTIEYNARTTHVKSRPGSTSTMRSGPIVMYTESLTGHLSRLVGVPVPDVGAITLTPDTLPKFLYDLIGKVPVPLDLELTGVKAVQAGQFGGTLKIPGMHLYTDGEPYDG
ncbi:hypothetical protein [Peterkaempfera bronchialis]|uniref:hypothetical protein n=1 Tax=Peterkaempfera bronchialis TaxID=2126346 RepID=UPI003C2C1EA0